MTENDSRNRQALDGDEYRPGSLWSRLERLVLIPNLILVAFVVLYMISSQQKEQVSSMVEGDTETTRRIAELERKLLRDPGNMTGALELARLYQDVGEFPWSYNALKGAERRGNKDPSWRLMLGLAYLELGKNKDSVRVLDAAHERCGKTRCGANVTVKLELFSRIANIFLKRKIDSRKHHSEAEKAFHEVLKPVEVDPDKMRPKAPATPEPGPGKKPAVDRKTSPQKS